MRRLQMRFISVQAGSEVRRRAGFLGVGSGSSAYLRRRLGAAAVLLSAGAAPGDYFGLHFVDAQTGRGVPLVTAELTDKQRLVSDSNGYVAFDEPGLMDQRVFFGVRSYGYEAADVGFGNSGAVVRTTPGTVVEVKLKRTNIAQRLYRLTGAGIYRDTVLLGKAAPVAHPLLDGRVMGQDTVQTVVYQGRMLWCWGDTDRPDFPLGLFSTAGATSKLPGELTPDAGIDYTYFTGKDGFCRPMIALPKQPSLPVWIDALMNVPDARGQERLLARYVVTRDLKLVGRGLLEFDDATQTFGEVRPIPLDGPTCPGGHPMRARAGGVDYYYFPDPFPALRVRADYAHASDPAAYEGFTCLKPDGAAVDRDASGKLLWTWQTNTRPLGPAGAGRLVSSGAIRAAESPYRMRDADTGRPVRVANGSVAWDAWAKRWLMVFGQQGGASNLGEVFVAYANAPEGPWTDARKVATHAAKGNDNDFYNPMLHAEFMGDGGRVVYFEGTFVNTFSGNPWPTPRYNYNQIMYRVDLSDPRIRLPDPPPGLGNAGPSPLGP